MIVKCNNNEFCSTLTLGKEYHVIEEGDIYYVIMDDINEEITTKKTRFDIIEDNDLVKKIKATITELNFQLKKGYPDIKDFKIRKDSKGEIKEILIKFNY